METQRPSIESELIAIISRVARRSPDELPMSTPLSESGIDSLALLEIVFSIEEKFGIVMPINANDPAVQALSTVGEVVDMVVDLILAKRQPAAA